MSELQQQHGTIVDTMRSVILSQDIDPDRLEKILNLQFKWEERSAEQSFNRAMTTFQKECPIINKTKKVKDRNGNERMAYAPLDEIVHKVKPLLAKFGFGYSFSDKFISDSLHDMTIEVSHIDGHRMRFSYLYNPIDDGGNMNTQQRRKSSLSYAKRAAFENAFGIITQGEDDDAVRAGETEANYEDMQQIDELIALTNSDKAKLFSHLQIPEHGGISQADARLLLKSLNAKRLLNLKKAGIK